MPSSPEAQGRSPGTHGSIPCAACVAMAGTEDAAESVARLQFGGHACCLFEDDEEHRTLVAPYVRQGLEQHERVMYLADSRPAEAVIALLRDSGVDAAAGRENGQLAIFTAEEAYLRGGAFDPDAMIGILRTETDRALADGHAGLRVTGEMTWALRGRPGSHRLIEYEARLNDVLPGSRALGLCQYDRRTFAPDLLLQVLNTHPTAVLGTTIYDNFYYMPPEDYLGDDVPAATLRQWTRNLVAYKTAQEGLARHVDALERSNEDLQQFAYAASHDMREPLRTIAGYAEVLSRRYRGRLDADADHFLASILSGATRLRVLLDSLLAYARAGQDSQPRHRVEVSAPLGEVISDLQAAICESGALVTADALPVVTADPVQLAQVLGNLLGNALKFRGDEAPRIHLEARRAGDYWVFSVRDNGIGIEARHLGSLFQVFHRAHDRKDYPGSGMGLAICRRIVEKRGGHIWVESVPSKGSTFYFTWPAGEGGPGPESS